MPHVFLQHCSPCCFIALRQGLSLKWKLAVWGSLEASEICLSLSSNAGVIGTRIHPYAYIDVVYECFGRLYVNITIWCSPPYSTPWQTSSCVPHYYILILFLCDNPLSTISNVHCGMKIFLGKCIYQIRKQRQRKLWMPSSLAWWISEFIGEFNWCC